MSDVLAGLRALGPARLVALGGIAAAMLALFALLALRGGSSSGGMALLYADLDPRETAQIADRLDHARIVHVESPTADRIEVPAADVARARLLLARDGLPSGGSIGYEIFDKADPLGETDFHLAINETRAMEGEIARSIRMIAGVRAARVHLVLPRRQIFAQAAEPAQASVMLTMAGAARLDPQEVQAVLNLVAAAVPGLKPQAIAVVDNRGTLLARAGQGDDANDAASVEELRRSEEMRLGRAVEEMLERTLGPGHVRAQASVTMRFDHHAQTQESFDPDQQVVRSTQTSTSNSRSSEGEKPVTVQNNLPNADAGAASQSGSQEQKQEETTNYEIGKTVTTTTSDQPQVARVSIAVMVDGVMAGGAGGKPQWQPRSAEELGRIRGIVQSAIGYDAKRGDTVEVVCMPFVQADDASAPASSPWLALGRGDMLALGQSMLLAAAVLGAMVMVLRPMALQLIRLPDEQLALPAGQPALLGAQAGHGTDALLGARAPALPALPAPAAMAALAGDGPGSLAGPGNEAMAEEGMVAIANVEGQMRAASIKQLAGMVEKHPEETLSIIRGWLMQERG